MIHSILSKRMKTILAVACPPLILISAAGISLFMTDPSSKASPKKNASSNVATIIPDINTGTVPMSRREISELRSSWDNALSWWWLQNKPIPWDARCAGTSRDSYRQGWYPLACFMIPVQRIQATTVSGRLSLGETQVYSLNNISLGNGNVTSDITVLDCRKGHGCKPTVLHRLTMAKQYWDVLRDMISVVRGDVPEEKAAASPSAGQSAHH